MCDHIREGERNRMCDYIRGERETGCVTILGGGEKQDV